MQKTLRSLGQEDPLEKELSTHPSILAWKIAWTEESGRLQSMGLQRVRHDWAAKLLQSCLTLCNPIDSSQPGFPVTGILQAGTVEWVAISFSNAWKWKVKVKPFSHVRLAVTPWTAAYQAPLSMGFSRQEYWSGLPLPSPVTEHAYTKNKRINLTDNSANKYYVYISSKVNYKHPKVAVLPFPMPTSLCLHCSPWYSSAIGSLPNEG